MVERNQNIIRFRCTQCGSPLKAMVTRVGHELSCPQCGAEVEVPAGDGPSSAATERTVPRVSKPSASTVPHAPGAPTASPPDDEYAVRGMDYSAREPLPHQHSGPVVPVADLPDDYEAPGRRPDRSWEGEEVKPPDERPELPSRPMVDGVLSIFRQPRVITCWAILSILVAGLLWVVYYAIVLSSIFALPTLIGGVVLSGCATLGSLLVLTILNAYLMVILHDSAAGNDQIENWPDVVFLTWATDAFFLITSFSVPFILAWLVAQPFGGLLAGGYWWILPPIYWLLFPVVMLSTLEMQSPLLPVSPVVVQSFWHCGRTWGVFYLQTAVIGGLVLLMALGFHTSGLTGFLGMAILGGVTTFALMLYFRLLGRLAWVCDERFRELSAEDAEDEEDEEGLDDAVAPEIRPVPVDDF